MLLEFPPVIGGKRLYLLNDSGKLFAIHKHTGKTLWKRKLGALAAASPAYADGIVYAVLLQRTRERLGPRSGRVVALDGKTGKIRWSRELASRSESSPLIAGDRLYFGSENGTVYSMGARRRARALALPRRGRGQGRAGAGRRQALLRRLRRARVRDPGRSSGRQAWRASTHGGRFGLGAGNFYSTPGGRVRARLPRQHRRADLLVLGGQRPAGLEQEHRRLRLRLARRGAGAGRAADWSTRAPTAAASTPWTRAAARVRWSRGGNGRISGGASVIGDIVYYADLGNKRTIGLGARTGRKVFEHERGSYNPVVSDGETIFLTGYHAMYALQPLSTADKKARAKAARARKARKRNDRRICRTRAREAHRGRPAAQQRSYRRCVKRRPALRRRAARAECLQRARKAAQGRQGQDQPLVPALRGPPARAPPLRRTGTPAASRTALTSATEWRP